MGERHDVSGKECHIQIGIWPNRGWRSVTAMPRTAKVFTTNRSQAVRLPKE